MTQNVYPWRNGNIVTYCNKPRMTRVIYYTVLKISVLANRHSICNGDFERRSIINF